MTNPTAHHTLSAAARHYGVPLKRKRGNKYGAKATVVDGIRFDSKGEAVRDSELRLEQAAGVINNLERQVRYELGVYPDTGRKICYKPDWRYTITATGEQVVEDYKGCDTRDSRTRRAWLYQRYGVKVKVTGRKKRA